LDIETFHLTLPDTENGESGDFGLALGAAIILALMIYFSFIPYGLVSIMSIVKGAVGFSCIKKGKAMPKALLIVTAILKGLALISSAFFLIMTFEDLFAWAAVLLVTTVVLIASVVFDFVALKGDVNNVPMVRDTEYLETFDDNKAA
jgi:amino acid transporter